MTTPAQPADGVDALWRGFRHEFDGGETECFDHKDPDCKTCEPVVLIRESDYRTLAASKADSAQGDWPEAAQVCAEAYQVVGCLLDDLGIFSTPEAQKILDNLSEHRLVHRDVIPWRTPQPEGGRGEAVATFVGYDSWRRAAVEWHSYSIPPGTKLYATPTDAARVRDAWLPIESAPQDGTLGPIGESPKTIADEMEAWSEKKMSANGSSRIDRTLVREWAKRLRGEA